MIACRRARARAVIHSQKPRDGDARCALQCAKWRVIGAADAAARWLCARLRRLRVDAAHRLKVGRVCAAAESFKSFQF